MPDWISDPSPTVYLVLFVFVVAAGVVWLRRRNRRTLVLLIAAATLLGLVFLIDRLVESPREQATQAVKEMAAAATAANGNEFVRHLSDQASIQGAGKEKVRNSGAWGLVRQYKARVSVWDFGHDSYRRISDSEIEIGFMAKAEAADGGFVMRYVVARFVRDPDGQYRVKTVKFYNPADRGMNVEDPIPNFP